MVTVLCWESGYSFSVELDGMCFEILGSSWKIKSLCFGAFELCRRQPCGIWLHQCMCLVHVRKKKCFSYKHFPVMNQCFLNWYNTLLDITDVI